MKLAKVGQIVNTHGIKGELRIMSGSRYSYNEFFDTDYVYIDGQKYEVTSYRRHKAFHMITINGINDINKVEHLVGKDIYVDAKQIEESDEINYNDLIGKDMMFNGKKVGTVTSIGETPLYKLIVCEKGIMIPFSDNFIKNVSKTIELKNVEGFFDGK